MAIASLIQRLMGITAICLIAMMAPISTTQRIGLLTALSLGLAVAAVLPGYDRLAARTIGPSVLVLALAPMAGFWAPVQLVAAFLAGVAGFNRVGMTRLVPALGLPLGLLLARTGTGVSTPVMASWAALVFLVIVLGNRIAFAELGPHLAPTDPSPGRAGRAFSAHRLHHALLAMVVVVPVAIAVAAPLNQVWAGMGGAPVGSSPRSGSAAANHPGLSGGLDAGAPVVLDDDIVLRVAAERPLYWRAVSYDNWDGRRWTRTLEPEADPTPGPNAALTTLEPDGTDGIDRASDLVSVPLRQRFTLVGADLDVAVAAWRAEEVEVEGYDAVLEADGSIAVPGQLAAGMSWLVTSNVVPATADDLRAADPATALDPDSPVLATFAVEDDVVPQVAELARRVTADAPTTYDKVRALERWMDENLTYTREIDRLAPGRDAVSDLLFHSRRGFCEQIGSALVVMLRSLGIPARLVVGYVPGSYDGATGEWLSRGTDAHAWAEVYFPGLGWHGFDPTAGVPLAGEPARLVESGGPAQPIPTSGVGLVVVAMVVAVGVGAGGLIVATRRFRARFGPRRSATGDGARPARRRRGHPGRSRAEEGRPESAAFMAQFDAAGRDLGCRWTETMTIRQKGEALIAAGLDPEVVQRAVRSLEALLFFADGGPRVFADGGPRVFADGGPRAGADLSAELSAAFGQLQWCLEVYDFPAPAPTPVPASGGEP